MGISGILVATRREHVDVCVRALERIPGVATHRVEAATGRIVLTQEADDLEAHTAGLQRIQQIPHVLLAELVYHYVGDGAAAGGVDGVSGSEPAPPFEE